jgi:hypothetical protein
LLRKDTLDSRFLNYVLVEYPGYKAHNRLEQAIGLVLEECGVETVDIDTGYQETGNRQSGRLVSFRVRNQKIARTLVTIYRELLTIYFPQHIPSKVGMGPNVGGTFVDTWRLDPTYFGTGGRQLNDVIKDYYKAKNG